MALAFGISFCSFFLPSPSIIGDLEHFPQLIKFQFHSTHTHTFSAVGGRGTGGCICPIHYSHLHFLAPVPELSFLYPHPHQFFYTCFSYGRSLFPIPDMPETFLFPKTCFGRLPSSPSILTWFGFYFILYFLGGGTPIVPFPPPPFLPLPLPALFPYQKYDDNLYASLPLLHSTTRFTCTPLFAFFFLIMCIVLYMHFVVNSSSLPHVYLLPFPLFIYNNLYHTYTCAHMAFGLI